MLKRGSCGAAEKREKGVLSAGHSYHPFRGNNLPRVYMWPPGDTDLERGYGDVPRS